MCQASDGNSRKGVLLRECTVCPTLFAHFFSQGGDAGKIYR